MPEFDDVYLNDLRSRGQTHLSSEVPCLFHRFSLGVEAGEGVYDLPSDLLSIIQVTYKGFKVEPLDFKTAREHGFEIDPLSDTKIGRPKFYFMHNLGQFKLCFWPSPDETITADDTGIWNDDEEIKARVIVTAWRVASDDIPLPDYLRRRLIKDYVAYKAYAKEGPTQVMEISEFFRERYQISLAHLRRIMNTLPKAADDAMLPNAPRQALVSRPVLPNNFGVKVR